MTGTGTFTGFPREGLRLLSELAANNHRAWFEAHQAEYQERVTAPAQAFVAALGERLRTIAPAIRTDARTDGTGVLMRVHRDTRFSRDKSPYKANISGLFWEGAGKKTESPAFGFQVEPDGMGLMAGIFAFPPARIDRYREAVLDARAGHDLAARLATVQGSADYTLGGEALKRVPAGYDPAHPHADLLRRKGLYVASPRIWPEEIVTPTLVDICFDHFLQMAPVQRWLAALWQRG